MRKELPLVDSPKTSHNLNGCLLAIILNNEDNWNWFYSEYIQLRAYCLRNGDADLGLYKYGSRFDTIDEFDMPLYSEKIYPFNLKNQEDIIKEFEMYIDNEFYPFVICDDYYISTMNIENHRAHDLLFYGYDNEEKIFLTFAFNGSKMQKFHVSYEDVIKAVFAEETRHEKRTNAFFKLKNKKYPLNLEKIKWHLLDYYECVDTLSRERPWIKPQYKESWGLNVYENLKRKFIWTFGVQKNVSYAQMYLLYEHKKDMVGRIKYLKQHSNLSYTDEILAGFEEVERESLILVNQTIKLNTMRFEACERELDKALIRIDNIRSIEKNAIEKYLNYNEAEFNKI